MDPILLQQVGLSIALGLLIGAERERTQSKKKFKEFAGIRTFACICLFGYLSALLGSFIHWSLSIVAFTLFVGFVIILYLTRSHGRKVFGFTTELAAILTFLVGTLMLYDMFLSIVIGVALSVLLALKEAIHNIVHYISDKEFYAILQFVIIAFIILPILPKEAFDPWGILVPYTLWFTVVLISAIGFVGYFLTKIMGVEKSSRVVGLFGGLASSTAVNVTFATESKEITQKATISTLISSNLLAIASSFLRILFFIWLINPQLFFYTLPYMGVLMGTFLLLSLLFRFLHGNVGFRPSKFHLKNPLHLLGAVKFALFLIAILIFTTLANNSLGTTGIFISSFLSGLAKGDAIAIALASLTLEGSISYSLALQGLFVSIGSSLVAKWVVGQFIGSKSYALHLLLAYSIPCLGILTFLLLS